MTHNVSITNVKVTERIVTKQKPTQNVQQYTVITEQLCASKQIFTKRTITSNFLSCNCSPPNPWISVPCALTYSNPKYDQLHQTEVYQPMDYCAVCPNLTQDMVSQTEQKYTNL
jgi:hypothetical protein